MATSKKTTDRQKFEQAVEMAEKLAARAAELEHKLSAAAAADRKRQKMLAGLPPMTSAANIDARLARLAELCGEFVPTSDPSKFGGFSESECKRVTESQRRAALRSPKHGSSK